MPVRASGNQNSMSIASKSDQEPIVHGVKSKIRKKTAGKSSSDPEYAQANFQNPSEDQAILMAQAKELEAFIGFSGNGWAGQRLVVFLQGQSFLWAVNCRSTT